MDLLGDVGEMESCFGPFGDNVNLHARQVHGLRLMSNRLGNHFRHTRWNSVEPRFGLFGDSVSLSTT
jgi:hypothetical protein